MVIAMSTSLIILSTFLISNNFDSDLSNFIISFFLTGCIVPVFLSNATIYFEVFLRILSATVRVTTTDGSSICAS